MPDPPVSQSETWVVVTQSDGDNKDRWLPSGIRNERIVHAVTADEAIERAFKACSVLEHKRGITATAHRVIAKPAGHWRSQYEHPERDDGPHEHCPDYGKRVTVKL